MFDMPTHRIIWVEQAYYYNVFIIYSILVSDCYLRLGPGAGTDRHTPMAAGQRDEPKAKSRWRPPRWVAVRAGARINLQISVEY